MMSFWVVPASWCATSARSSLVEPVETSFCSSATTWYIASSHIAVALMVIEVFIPVSGMSSNSLRISPRCGTGTPTLPTSPRASGESGSYPVCVGRSKATDSPVCPLARFVR